MTVGTPLIHLDWRFAGRQQWVAESERRLRFVMTRLPNGYELERARIRDGRVVGVKIAGIYPTRDAAELAAARTANRPPFSGEVDIGGEPYDTDDETRGLIHVPCGEWTNGGEDTITAHQCWWDRPAQFESFLAWLTRNADESDIEDARVRPWRWNAEAREAGIL